jgi:hypothetical protein
MSLKALGKRKAEPDSDSEGDFPEIHDFSDEAEDTGDEEILNELEEEQRLERELAEEQASDSDSDAGSDLSGWLARHSGLPDDAEGFTPGTSPDQDVVLDCQSAPLSRRRCCSKPYSPDAWNERVERLRLRHLLRIPCLLCRTRPDNPNANSSRRAKLAHRTSVRTRPSARRPRPQQS